MLFSISTALPKTNLKRVTAYIDPALYTRLEKLAALDKRTISQMVGILIERGVEKAEERKTEPSNLVS